MSALEADGDAVIDAVVEAMPVAADAACCNEPGAMVVTQALQTPDGNAGEPAFARLAIAFGVAHPRPEEMTPLIPFSTPSS